MYKKYNKQNDIISHNSNPKRRHKKDENVSKTEYEKPHKVVTEHVYSKHQEISKNNEEKQHQNRHKSVENKQDNIYEKSTLYNNQKEKVMNESSNIIKHHTRKRHHSLRSTESFNKSQIKKHEHLPKGKTFNLETKRPNKSPDDKNKNTYLKKHRSRSEQKSVNGTKNKVSQIWYCQVETDSPFKQPKNDPEEKHSQKEKATSTNRNYDSPEKQVLNVLSASVHKSRIHHFKDPKLSTVITSKPDRNKHLRKNEKCSQDLTKYNKNEEVDKKIEDSMKMYFTKLQNLIDKKLDSLLHAKDAPNEEKKDKREHKHKSGKRFRNVSHTSKGRTKIPFTDENDLIKNNNNVLINTPSTSLSRDKHRRYHIDNQHNSIISVEIPTKHQNILCNVETQVNFEAHTPKCNKKSNTIKKRDKKEMFKPPSNSIMYVTPTRPKDDNLNFYYYNKKASKSINTQEDSKEEYQFWVEGVEPAKKDTFFKTQKKKTVPNLGCKTVSVVGIPPQIKPNYFPEDVIVPIEEILEKKNRLKRFQLYYQYSLDNQNLFSDGSNTGRKRVPSESFRMLSDTSDSKSETKEINVIKAPNNKKNHDNSTLINIKLDDKHNFYLKENRDEHKKKQKSKKNIEKPSKDVQKIPHRNRKQHITEAVLYSKSDMDISYSSLIIKSHYLRKNKLNIEDLTLKEFYNNVDFFKPSFEQQTPEILQFLEKMHQLYLATSKGKQLKTEDLKENKVCQDSYKSITKKSSETQEPISVKIQSKQKSISKNKSVEVCENLEETINTKINKMTSYQELLSQKIEASLDENQQKENFTETMTFNSVATSDDTIEESIFQLPTIRNRQLTNLSDEYCQQPKKYTTKKFGNTCAVGVEKGDSKNITSTESKIHKRNLKKNSAQKLPTTPPTRDVDKIPKNTINTKFKKCVRSTHSTIKETGLTLPTILESKDKLKDDIRKKTKRPRSASGKIGEESRNNINNFKVKKSQSEINFGNLDLKLDESKITSVHDCQNDTQSQDKAHSLDRYLLSNKSLINEHSYCSRLMITKDYHTTDISSYQKRKKYDEIMRKKMKKKINSQEKPLGQIFEVRYLTLNNNTNLKKIKSEDNMLDSNLFEIMLPEVENSYPTCGNNFMHFINHLCTSLKTKFEKSVKLTNRAVTKKSISRKKKLFNMHKTVEDSTSSSNEECQEDIKLSLNKISEHPDHMSCPALSSYDSSFDFLYQDDSNEEKLERKPLNSILGFSVNSETKLNKNVESPGSETSGYASSRSKHSFSFSNFFKKPKMAALLKPQIEEGMFGKNNNNIHYEEIPDSSSNYNIRYSESAPCNKLKEEVVLKKFASDTDLISNEINSQNKSSVDLLFEKDSDQNISWFEKMLDSNMYLTNLSSCSITLVGSDFSKESLKTVKEGITNPSEIKRLITKKFFENILEMYEKEAALSSALFEDEDFMENQLMSSINVWKKEERKNQRFTSRLKRVLKKVFFSKQKLSMGEEFLLQNIEKPAPIDNEYQKKLQALASSAHKYFSMLVQAVAINNKMDDEMKMYGILRLLEAIEDGHFTFLKKFTSSQGADLEAEIREQVKQTFVNVYLFAKSEADKCRRKLSNNDMKFMGAFVCKYRIGLMSRTDIVASYLGKGLFENENQLKAAVIYLLKTTNDVDLQDFERFYRNHFIENF